MAYILCVCFIKYRIFLNAQAWLAVPNAVLNPIAVFGGTNIIEYILRASSLLFIREATVAASLVPSVSCF